MTNSTASDICISMISACHSYSLHRFVEYDYVGIPDSVALGPRSAGGYSVRREELTPVGEELRVVMLTFPWT